MTWDAGILIGIRNGSLKKLVSSDEIIDTQDIKELINALKSPDCKIWSLVLRKTKPGIGGLLAIAGVLRSAPIIHFGLDYSLNEDELKILTLPLASSHCRVMNLAIDISTRKGMLEIGSLLKSPYCKLTKLFLFGNFNTKGCEALAEGIRDSNCKLVYLNFGYIPYPEMGNWKFISEAITDNFNLLYCGSMAIVPEVANALRRNLEQFVTICKAIVKGQEITFEVEERIIRQCQIVSIMPEFFKDNAVLAYKTIARLQQMDMALYNLEIPYVPDVLKEIIIQYLVRDVDDNLYISLASGFNHNIVKAKRIRDLNRRDDDVCVKRCRHGMSMANMQIDQDIDDHEFIESSYESDASTVECDIDYEVDGEATEQVDSSEVQNEEEFISNEYQKNFSLCGHDVQALQSSKALLMILLPWIKDLSDLQQQKIFSSYTVEQVLKLLEATTDSHKLVNSQLMHQPIEDLFIVEYKKYYGQDELNQTRLQDDAIAAQYDSSAFVYDDSIMVENNGILKYPLPNSFNLLCS